MYITLEPYTVPSTTTNLFQVPGWCSWLSEVRLRYVTHYSIRFIVISLFLDNYSFKIRKNLVFFFFLVEWKIFVTNLIVYTPQTSYPELCVISTVLVQISTIKREQQQCVRMIQTSECLIITTLNVIDTNCKKNLNICKSKKPDFYR